MQFTDFNLRRWRLFFGFAQVYFFVFVVIPTMRGRVSKTVQNPWVDEGGKVPRAGVGSAVAAPFPARNSQIGCDRIT
jgi:cytochrome c oxidase subunit 1